MSQNHHRLSVALDAVGETDAEILASLRFQHLFVLLTSGHYSQLAYDVKSSGRMEAIGTLCAINTLSKGDQTNRQNV